MSSDPNDLVSDQMALALSNILSSIDPDDSDALEATITRFNESEVAAKDGALSNSVSQDIFDNMKRYHAMTDILGQMNEAQNANVYAKQIIDSESSRLTKLTLSLLKELHKMQQRYLVMSYKRKHVRFVTDIMLMTVFVTCLLAIVTAAFLQGWMYVTLYTILVVIIVTLYSVGLIIAFSHAARRRSNHWKQFYWSVSDSMKRALNNKKNKHKGDSSDVGPCE